MTIEAVSGAGVGVVAVAAASKGAPRIADNHQGLGRGEEGQSHTGFRGRRPY